MNGFLHINDDLHIQVSSIVSIKNDDYQIIIKTISGKRITVDCDINDYSESEKTFYTIGKVLTDGGIKLILIDDNLFINLSNVDCIEYDIPGFCIKVTCRDKKIYIQNFYDKEEIERAIKNLDHVAMDAILENLSIPNEPKLEPPVPIRPKPTTSPF